MKILLSGGGTLGHITPLLAVAAELKKQHPRCKIIYVGEKNGKFTQILKDSESIDEINTVMAGKLRRYHGESWLERLLDIKTILLNLRDIFLIFIGFIQSIFLVRKIKPDVAFLKGGYVVVPVGFACALWRVPYVTHDSDALPGLANRLVAPWAAIHATALPEEFYMYPRDKTRNVGVLVGDAYQLISDQDQKKFKNQLGIPLDCRMLLITGGSQGARRLNESVADIVPSLLKDYPDLYIFHQLGKKSGNLYENFASNRLAGLEFISDMHQYSGAADVVVARAGANTLGELAVQGKAVIVVPNKQLTGGHQIKNAERLEELGAAVSIYEKNRKKDAEKLNDAIRMLLKDSDKRKSLGLKLNKAYSSNASKKLANLITDVRNDKNKTH